MAFYENTIVAKQDLAEKDLKTLKDIEKKIKLDSSIIRHLTVKYKKLDTKNEFFKKPN